VRRDIGVLSVACEVDELIFKLLKGPWAIWQREPTVHAVGKKCCAFFLYIPTNMAQFSRAPDFFLKCFVNESLLVPEFACLRSLQNPLPQGHPFATHALDSTWASLHSTSNNSIQTTDGLIHLRFKCQT